MLRIMPIFFCYLYSQLAGYFACLMATHTISNNCQCLSMVIQKNCTCIFVCRSYLSYVRHKFSVHTITSFTKTISMFYISFYFLTNLVIKYPSSFIVCGNNCTPSAVISAFSPNCSAACFTYASSTSYSLCSFKKDFTRSLFSVLLTVHVLYTNFPLSFNNGATSFKIANCTCCKLSMSFSCLLYLISALERSTPKPVQGASTIMRSNDFSSCTSLNVLASCACVLTLVRPRRFTFLSINFILFLCKSYA